ncbi:acetylornithine deacetylase [Legionella sp. MW5194]|uniref:acetylornithine deacetylase n=1 Tax=Legionella sp. MW5194 TaxID=2662448 RepID=UPI00193CEE2F|nr:acetylornithine deacetylase [Legionella sp. MW5194]QRN03031.1 acetylornithine deacetylase [Legionella sp. MW5194]
MNKFEWLHRLIGFNTVSSNSNLGFIQEIAVWFESHQIETTIIPGTTDDKANLLATLPASNGNRQGGLLLSGHTDVVPVAGQLWETDPFQAVEKDGRIYGRGACDMKGFLAVMLSLVPEIKSYTLHKPVHFAFTCDEEIGCLGVDFVAEHLKKIKLQPEGCIIGEPSGMKPIVGEKSRRVYHCQVQGKAAHSSMVTEGCNAIEYASRLITYINDLFNHLKTIGPFDDAFNIPYSTLSTNLISGGNASNIIPGLCEFMLEIRYIPEFPLEHFRSQVENHINEQLLPEMQKTFKEAAIYFDQVSDASGFTAREDAAITHLLRTVTGVKERLKVSYATEASAFQDMGIPTIICGPGDIAEAHRPNEFVTLDQLTICEHVLKNVIHFFCGQAAC